MTREVPFKPCSLISSPAIKIHHSPETSLWQIRLGKSGKAPPPFSWWQCQLTFALWCATDGCGVSFEDHLQAEKHPLLASLYRFHAFYTTRRLLEELSVALQWDQSHSYYENFYHSRAYKSGFALSVGYCQIRNCDRSSTTGVKSR